MGHGVGGVSAVEGAHLVFDVAGTGGHCDPMRGAPAAQRSSFLFRYPRKPSSMLSLPWAARAMRKGGGSWKRQGYKKGWVNAEDIVHWGINKRENKRRDGRIESQDNVADAKDTVQERGIRRWRSPHSESQRRVRDIDAVAISRGQSERGSLGKRTRRGDSVYGTAPTRCTLFGCIWTKSEWHSASERAMACGCQSCDTESPRRDRSALTRCRSPLARGTKAISGDVDIAWITLGFLSRMEEERKVRAFDPDHPKRGKQRVVELGIRPKAAIEKNKILWFDKAFLWVTLVCHSKYQGKSERFETVDSRFSRFPRNKWHKRQIYRPRDLRRGFCSLPGHSLHFLVLQKAFNLAL
ncbi:hypothetical protein DFH06DRAFT_1124023 [Mycena polygramma]|nr:hypothetical protein DFH06DRAFT_1359403 [Mycena polygramma]KAJ7673307.1 hypothetical protein DFH06DRAFT_1124023 [Mycena polygramma]